MKRKWQNVIKSKEDYDKLVSTGYAWEFWMELPASWQECYKELSEEENMADVFDEVVVKIISTDWCQSCKVLKQSLEREGIDFSVIDADEFANQDYVSKLSVRSLPTTLIEVDGVIKGKIQGLISVVALRKVVEDIVNEMEDV